MTYKLLYYVVHTPFPTFPHGGRGKQNPFPLGETGKGGKNYNKQKTENL